MDTIIYTLGLSALGFFIWKSKISMGWKKFILACLAIAIIGTFFTLLTGKSIGFVLRQLIVR